jgi:hypothetical protein
VAGPLLPREIAVVDDVVAQCLYLMTGDDTLRAVAQPRPIALPPAERTVGQLVGETVRFYGDNFWPSLALGVPAAAVAVLFKEVSRDVRFVLAPSVAGALVSLAYVAACVLVLDRRPPRTRLVIAWLTGWLVFAPAPFLVLGFVVPGLLWLAAFGLVVPVLVVENVGIRAAFARSWTLARADFVHAVATLFTLAILVILSQGVLVFVLRGFGNNGLSAALFLASVVLSPLLFIGTALLYVDQAARVK